MNASVGVENYITFMRDETKDDTMSNCVEEKKKDVYILKKIIEKSNNIGNHDTEKSFIEPVGVVTALGFPLKWLFVLVVFFG